MTVTQGGTRTAAGRPFAAAVMQIIRARARHQSVSAGCGFVNTHCAAACARVQAPDNPGAACTGALRPANP